MNQEHFTRADASTSLTTRRRPAVSADLIICIGYSPVGTGRPWNSGDATLVRIDVPAYEPAIPFPIWNWSGYYAAA